MLEQIAIQSKIRSRFIELQTKNPAFSLRAFARKLNLSPSAVSEILNGKRKISEKMAQKIMERLILDPAELDEISRLFQDKKNKKDLKSFQNSETNSETSENQILQTYEQHIQYLKLSSDQFSVISEWQHYALLSLIETQDFKFNISWISKRLGLTETEVQKTIDRLIDLKLLKIENETLILSKQPLTTTDDISSKAVRKSHYGDLKLAENALDNIPVSDRDFTSVTVAVDKSKLSEAKKMIREFQDKLALFLEDGPKTEVFKMSFYIYPLTQSDSLSENSTTGDLYEKV